MLLMELLRRTVALCWKGERLPRAAGASESHAEAEKTFLDVQGDAAGWRRTVHFYLAIVSIKSWRSP